jgi:uncharacterized protein YjeT (DUF2065 family)
MIPIPANVKAVLVSVLFAIGGALIALQKVEPGWAWLSAAVGIVLYLEGLFTTPPAAKEKIRALQAMAGKTLTTLALMMLGAIGCSSCGAITPTVATDVTAGVNFAVCVLGQLAQCESASPPTSWPVCSMNIVAACGGTALQVAQIVDAHNAALIKAGYVPKVIVDAGTQ